MRVWVAAFFALVMTWLPVQPVLAHALQPGYLEISHLGAETYRVFWRKPDVKGKAMALEAILPDTCTPSTGPAPRFDGTAWIASWSATCTGGLAGGQITIGGLEHTQTDVLVRYPSSTGTALTQRLTPDVTSFEVQSDPDVWTVIGSYFYLGLEHILGGFDHLLFVLALLLLIRDRWRLVGAITAFTLAHSITMAAATLGYVSLPGPPVEAVIALSIMFVASELLKRDPGTPRFSELYPWTVSFLFGLLHGFGFAGALADIGLPPGDVPLALLSFNLGVEAGQLLFIAVILVAGYTLKRLLEPRGLLPPKVRMNVSWGSAQLIGIMAAFWLIERVTGILV
jgi:hydrogenase/urease accessory protein HupE